MSKKFDAAEKRVYFRKKNEPMMISNKLLEEVGINPNADIHIFLEHGAIIINHGVHQSKESFCRNRQQR